MLMYEKKLIDSQKVLKDSSDKPIAVYCTTEKKCVLVFRNNELSNKYLFNKLQYQNNRTRYLVNARGKTSKNVFGIQLAFRYATPEQKWFLGKDEDVIVLDERFIRECYNIKTCKLIS